LKLIYFDTHTHTHTPSHTLIFANPIKDVLPKNI